MDEERESLLSGEHRDAASQGAHEMRQRGVSRAPQEDGVPQGRAVALAMFQAFADNEKVTGVPTVMPHEDKDSANWKRAEAYWENRYLQRTKNVLKNKVEAVCWLIAGAFVLNATDFFHTLYRSQDVNRIFLYIALVSMLALIIAVTYLIVRVGLMAGVDWDKLYNRTDEKKALQHPWWISVRNSIRVGAFSYCSCLICLPIAIWPVYSWWTFPILFILGMALLMSMHFVPTF